jgi:hypothetical protein
MSIIAIWLAWQLNLVRARRQFLDEYGVKFRFVTAQQWHSGEPLRVVNGRDNPPPSTISRVRLWMGDKPIQHYTLPADVSDELYRRSKRLFPEAAVSMTLVE